VTPDGVRVAVDVGSVRVGVATSDPGGTLASPVTTVRRDPRGRDLDEIADLVTARRAVEVVVGLPRTLAGREGVAVEMARSYARALAERVAPVPVRLVDERLSTVVAERGQRERGVRGRRGRSSVDAEAAAVVLQTVLDGAAR
jgi:putative Holliday junction resolvase